MGIQRTGERIWPLMLCLLLNHDLWVNDVMLCFFLFITKVRGPTFSVLFLHLFPLRPTKMSPNLEAWWPRVQILQFYNCSVILMNLSVILFWLVDHCDFASGIECVRLYLEFVLNWVVETWQITSLELSGPVIVRKTWFFQNYITEV